MPRMNQARNMDKLEIPGGVPFQFSGVRPGEIGATEQTLVVVALDLSSSVATFAKELNRTMETIVEACRKSARAENVLLRVVTFGDNVEELHGFKPVSEIVAGSYPAFRPEGMTALCDAAYTSVGSILAYGEQLRQQDLEVNGIAFVVTDGMENCSRTTVEMVRDLLAGAGIESMVSVLVGLGSDAKELEKFRVAAGMTQLVDAGKATVQNLARLGRFISRSIASQSRALGTGGPSQLLAF